MERHVALLRAVNVGGRKLPMAELRASLSEAGWAGIATFIQSGNVLFDAAPGRTALEAALERHLGERFALDVPTMVRSASEWPRILAANPFPDEAAAEPSRLMLCVSKAPPAPDAADALQERARDGERVRAAGGSLWVHYPAGAGTSRLSPAMFDRLAGSPVTARNWRTATKLAELLGCA